ncbi:MAG: START-like domain-containing protein [Spirosomataceae bacterium]
MAKYKFTREYSFKNSPKVLYSYLSSPGGLEQWFCSKVSVDSSHTYNFVWDNQPHLAKMTSSRLNKSARFDFISGEVEGNYVEFKLESSELDSSTYLKVIDYSNNSDEDELIDLWDDLIDQLKHIVGG